MFALAVEYARPLRCHAWLPACNALQNSMARSIFSPSSVSSVKRTSGVSFRKLPLSLNIWNMLESHRSLVFLLKPGKYSKNKMSESIVVTFTEGHAGERKNVLPFVYG